jgi:enoyl-CoA hydratase
MKDYNTLKTLKIENRDGVLLLTINRPDRRNTIDREVHDELDDLWNDFAEDPAVKAVVITGEGSTFSSGGDLKRLAGIAGTEEGFDFSLSLAGHGRRLFNNVMDLQKPLIAAVNGDAIGLGATLALYCDIVVMAEDARIGDPHVKVGLSAGDGGSIIWPLLVGPSRAKEYLMRGMLATGKEAERINLVNYALPAEEVVPYALKIAEELAALPSWAVRYTKATINIAMRQQFNASMDAALAYEALCMSTGDYAEATTAFTQKRKPRYSGR